MSLARLILPLALVLAAPAQAATSDPQAVAGCSPDAIRQARNEGYLQGVEDIRAQLAQATARMQQQVQDQLNRQLAQLQQQRDGDLKTRLRTAQQEALDRAVQAPMPGALTGADSPARLPVDQGAGAREGGPPQRPSDLPAGSRLVIDNAETLPPDLYAALMAYLEG